MDDTKLGMILQSNEDPLTPCSFYREIVELKSNTNNDPVEVKCPYCYKNQESKRCNCLGYKEFCSNCVITTEELASILNNFAEQIKQKFYYEFDEIIPSIMSDNIDKIKHEVLDEVHNTKH